MDDEATWTMDELLDRLRVALPRYRVTDVPDARTVRYYISLGLVDAPGARRGTFALYSPKHLLQVLTIKKLQAEYLPIKKIETLMAGRGAAQLEALLGGPVDVLALAPTRSPAPRAEPAARWSRFEVHPGVELHLRDGAPLDRAQLDAIGLELARILRDFTKRSNHEEPD